MRDVQPFPSRNWPHPEWADRVVSGPLLWRIVLPLAAAGVLGLMALAASNAFFISRAAAVESWSIELPRRNGGVDVRHPVAVYPPSVHARVEQVQLFEVRDGQEYAVPLAPLPAEGGELRRTDDQPLLAADRSYRLVLNGSAIGLNLPWAASVPVREEISFSTVGSPRALLPSSPLQLAYMQDIVVAWTEPLTSVEYEITPGAKSHAVIDPANPTQVRIVLESYREEQRYELTFTRAMAANGVALKQPAKLSFVTPQVSPRLSVPEAPVPMEYGQRLTTNWSQPLAEAVFEIAPAADARLEIDASNPTLAHLILEDYQPGTPYTLTFTNVVAANGVAMAEPSSLRFITPQHPRAMVAEEMPTLRLGQPLVLDWNIPVRSFSAEISDGARATAVVDPNNPSRGLVRMEGLAQGKQYTVTVTGAEATTGAQLKGEQRFTFRTPAPLSIAEFGPENGASGVRQSVNPYVTFSAPVADRAAAEQAFKVEPAVPGSFEWESPTTMIFRPEQPFEFESTVKLSLAGGPESVQSVDGGFMEQAFGASFTIEQARYIDVDISSQVLRLYEGDTVVFSTPVATGVPGADTPLGMYYVQYKMPTARFRGTNVDGSRYDIPNVPWVLAFWGDYTIHSAPWRGVFGRPGSNGCVSMTVPAAKHVYDWARVGTPIHIHM